MSDKPIFLRFAPGYLAVLMVGAVMANPAFAQTSTQTTVQNAAQPTPVKKSSAAQTAAKSSATSFVILSDVVVDGVQRSDPAAVFNFLPVKIGDRFFADSAQQVSKALYASGLYENVDVALDGTVLKIKLSERPVISELSIQGMKQFDKKAILAGLKSNGMAQGLPFDAAKIEQVKSEFTRMYQEAGLLSAKITSEVTKQDRNQVGVVIKIDEGKKVKVRKISIDGNTHVSDYTLRTVMDLDTNGILSWYTKDSLYSEERLKADIENIRAYYYDRGYLEFDVTDVKVTPSEGKNPGVDIALKVKEGEQYRVSSIALIGDTKGTPKAELDKLVKYRLGSVYSRDKVSKIVGKVQSRLGEDGYALGQVEVQPKLNTADHTVDVQIVVNPGERVYVRNVNISGNGRTRDEVIRREVRQMESALFNAQKVQLSRDRIDRLGFFDNVAAEVVPVEGTNNQVDVNYVVNEIPTGDLKLSLGYNTSNNVTLAGSITENNFLGSGSSLSAAVDTSKATQNLSISTGNPYFTKSGVSQDVSAYYRKTDYSELELSNTIYKTLGFKLMYGIPVSEQHRVYFGINPEYNKITLDKNASPMSFLKFMDTYGKGKNSFMTYGLNLGWSYDTRDSRLMPNRGQFHRILGEVVPFGDLKYYQLSYQYQQYIPLGKRFTLALNTELDYGKGYSGSAYPFYKNLYAGGLGSVRGYESGKVGPREAANPSNTSNSNDVYTGGNKRVIANLEFQFPIPGMTKSKQARLFLFADAAGLWGEKNSYTIPDSEGMRYSYGMGLVWNSPIGPLKFSYGLPIKKKPNDVLQKFQFQMGTSF
ncbi:MAG: bamA [Burkholderiaceae bacterium]|nr:bamA [Burkholderiaceae bacterium]